MTSTVTPAQQTFTFTVTTIAGTPLRDLGRALDRIDGVLGVKISAGNPDGPNRERLIQLAEWVGGEEAKRKLGLPSEWNQGDWLMRDAGITCGTACCIAGKVAFDDGGMPLFEKLDPETSEYVEVPWDSVEDGAAAGRVRFPDGTTVCVSEYAQAALGLTDEQARDLFASGNNYDRILTLVGRLLRWGEPTTVVRRRLRAGRTADCEDGEQCDICYEDVTEDDDGVPF